jgi:hypothetical protein|tara:strand:+ start:1942 stop:2982 length:1041 start_codon:yes stop_codon:yes gene_type:complete
MAIAPVNKFVSIAVPVAPGLQKLYEVPTGTSALLLYTQVSNVGIGVTYPTVTFTQKRTSRSTGNTRDIRVVKDAEIPPNDAVILIDGRLVLEKTPLVLDQIYIQGTQQGVGIITDVTYDEPSGIATVFTKTDHNFSVTDPITLSGIAFTCSGSTGITTTIFPDPQQSYTVDTVADSKQFSTVVGTSKGYPHFYNSAIHYFERARVGAVTVVNSQDGNPANGTKFNVTDAVYNGGPGTKTIHGISLAAGEIVLTIGTHNLQANDTISIADNSLIFTCTMDNRATEHAYPRSTDPASTNTSDFNNGVLPISIYSSTQVRVQVGESNSGGFFAPLQMELIASILENSTS